MRSTFETALDQHEVSEFFKGNGIYFARGSDWGDHLYISNWQEMCGVLKNQKAASSLLTNIFEEYVKYLHENYADAAGLLRNISAYYVLKQKNLVLSIDGYDLISALDEKSKNHIGTLFRLLRKEYNKNKENVLKHSFEQELNRIKNNDCPFEFEKL